MPWRFFLSLGHGHVHVQVLPQDENDPNRYRSVSFTVVLCCKILFPLMGFWNALIYFHIGCSSRRRRRNKKRSHRSPSLVDHDDTPSAQNEKNEIQQGDNDTLRSQTAMVAPPPSQFTPPPPPLRVKKAVVPIYFWCRTTTATTIAVERWC